MKRQRWWLALALVACEEPEEVDDPGCGPNPPVLGEVVMRDAGTREIDGETRRMIEVVTQADDEDGDLHKYTARIWYDTFVDGVLDGDADVVVPGVVTGGVECETLFGTVGAGVPLGDDIPFGSQMEFGLVIVDDAGTRRTTASR